MEIVPKFSLIKNNLKKGESQVIWTSVVADLETPVSAYIKLSKNEKNTFLLESVEGGEIRGRYSIIGMKPDLIWKCKGNKAKVSKLTEKKKPKFINEKIGSLDSLRNLLKECKIKLPDDLPPMASGIVGYMGFDTIRLIEEIRTKNISKLKLPDGVFIRPSIMAIFDSLKNVISLVAPIWYKKNMNPEKCYNEAIDRIQEAYDRLKQPIIEKNIQTLKSKKLKKILPKSNVSKLDYFKMIEKAKKLIIEGEIFQVVPSQRFSAPFKLPPFSLYRTLRRMNPSPFLYFLDFHIDNDYFSVVGSSPEILVRLRNKVVTVRPIAGTRPRGKSHAEDEFLKKDLLSDPKELSEHLMLLDLGRNDVGKVSKVGTVKVTEKMIVEYYSHVMHIVSNVEGKIKPEYDAIDALMAGFPAGTVSGAPKIRALEIINELETDSREIYAGCVGYFSANGSMDTCIALRTAIIKNEIMYVQAGGGIVADSQPDSEYQETYNKAQALFRAAEEAFKMN